MDFENKNPYLGKYPHNRVIAYAKIIILGYCTSGRKHVILFFYWGFSPEQGHCTFYRIKNYSDGRLFKQRMR
mgnify:CR=1 FL=1